LIERRAVDIIQPDAMFTGGITGAVQIARMARGTSHTWSGNGIGLMANMHLLGVTQLESPYDPPSFLIETRDMMLTEPIRFAANGTVALLKKPGLASI
jgi:L-alanine-DL-glutamate epimerase-like enolase superfamily enzyme